MNYYILLEISTNSFERLSFYVMEFVTGLLKEKAIINFYVN